MNMSLSRVFFATKLGLLTPQRLTSISQSLPRNQVGRAWRQPWTWGSPGPSQVFSRQAPDVTGPLHISEEQCAAITRRCAAEMWNKILKNYKPGKAFDCLGWSPETFLFAAHHQSNVIRRICHDMMTWKLIDVSFLILQQVRPWVVKDDKGDVRLLAVQTLF